MASGAAAATTDSGEVAGDVDVTALIDQKSVTALNAATHADHKCLFAADDRMTLTSDADEQLIIHFPLKDPVKLTGLEVRTPPGETRPTSISIFVNRESLDFSDAEAMEPDVKLDFDADSDTDLSKPKRFSFGHKAKLRMVNSVHMWVENESGSEVTKIASIQLFGRPTSGVGDLGALTKPTGPGAFQE